MKKVLFIASFILLSLQTIFAAPSVSRSNTSSERFTYSDVLTSPGTWSPTDWRNSNESPYLNWTTSPFYEFVPNATKDGYEIIPQLASKPVQDVTAQYAGTYGIPADATEGYAWKVEMRRDAKWEDGTPITVKDVEYSLQQFLNPEMKNYRADSYYDSFPIYKARDYYNGTAAYSPANEADDISELWTSISQPVVFFSDAMSSYGPGSGYESYWIVGGVNQWDIIASAAGESTYFKVTPELIKAFKKVAIGFGDTNPAAFLEFCYVREELEGTEWSEVGFIKDDDYTFTCIVDHAITEFMYYYTSGIYLIKEDLYEAGKKLTGGTIQSSYGTSPAEYSSYGPWKFESFQAGKSAHLVKNENWYGYSDPANTGLYQTTDIDIQFITDHETIKRLFLMGKLDIFTLAASDMAEYANSYYCDETPQSYTYKLSFNIDRASLSRRNRNGENHSIIANENFRHGVSLSLNRTEWCVATSPASQPGFGLLNYLYVAVPETGLLYRDTPQAQKTLMKFYGTNSLADITGYDVELAKIYFQAAYDEEVRAGYLKPTDRIVIDYHCYSSSEGNMKRVAFINDSITKATAGTSLQGKVTVRLIVDPDYYNSMKAGACDVIFGAWGGSPFDPYGILWCYCDPSARHEYGMDPTVETLTINIEGKNETRTLYGWYDILCNGDYAFKSNDVKNTILAAVEYNLLSRYNMIPLEYVTDISLHSQRYVPYSDHYINQLVGNGSLREATWTMNDEEWEAYCRANNNHLVY